MLEDVLAALRAGDHAAALAASTRWRDAEPSNADACLAMAHANAAMADTAGAAAALDEGLALAPDRADLLTARAYLHLKHRNLDAATAGLGAALANDPNQLPAYIALAHLAFARGDRAEAERLIAYARRIDDGHPRLLLLEAQLAKLQGRRDRVLPLLSAAAQQSPTDPLVQAAYGLALLEHGHLAFAEQALRNTLALTDAVPALRGALVSALEGQQRWDAALEEVLAWRALAPGRPAPVWLAARLRARLGQFEAALEDLAALRAMVPRHDDAVTLEVQIRDQLGGPEAVFAALEALTDADPMHAQPWRLMLAVAVEQQTPDLLARWLSAVPDSAEALERNALWAESQGNADAAVALAERAVVLDSARVRALELLARAAFAKPADEALASLEALWAGAGSGAARRALAGPLGLARMGVGQIVPALEAWWVPWAEGLVKGFPLPAPVSAAEAAPQPDGGAGRLVFGPPGSRVERVLAVLEQSDPQRTLLDRWTDTARSDGFSALRVAPAAAEAGSAATWRASFEGSGLEVNSLIDAMPHADGWTWATLHGMGVVAVLRDPRDLLLNWMAWGSAAGFLFPGPMVAAQWLAIVLEQLVALRDSDRARLVLVDADDLDGDTAAFAEELAKAFGLAEPPDLRPALALGQGPHGLPSDLPEGTWRLFAEPLGEAFAHLRPVAVSLGYSAE